MKANKAGQQALITILNGIYSEIRIIEDNLGIRVDANDFRPRIEYFHDAIRTLTSGVYGSKRLSVEFLAYDVAMLRYIQANPLARSKGTKNLSPGTGLMTGNEAEYTSGKGTANVKAQLAEFYKNYSVLFVALLSESADRDYQSKINECNEDVENIAAIEHATKKMAQKKDIAIDLEGMIEEYVDDPDLARKIRNLMGNKKNKMLASEALKKISEVTKNADKQIKATEHAHFTFATNQLAVYENARDVVKKMAVSGMNIVGNFVENAVREATRGGRGM